MKILIVDDSALMRQTIGDILRKIPNAEIDSARDGIDAIQKLVAWRPDVITLDINMPQMDGLTCLSHIMTSHPTPVVIVSSLTHEGALTTLEALHLGAVDFIGKPGGTICTKISELEDDIIEKVTNAARCSVAKGMITQKRNESSKVKKSKPKARICNQTEEIGFLGNELAIIGSSTGGPGAIESLLSNIPAPLPIPLIIAQHMPESFTKAFAVRLDRKLPFNVVEIDKVMSLNPGVIYVCKGDRDCIVSKRGNNLVAMPTPTDNGYLWHPSISKLVASATRVCSSKNLVTVLLTGMGDDGAQEMATVANQGGVALAQLASDCVVPSMPEALVEKASNILVGRADKLGIPLFDAATNLISREVCHGIN